MGQVSEGGRVGEEECRNGGAEPQIDGRKRGRISWTEEEVSGGIRMGVAAVTASEPPAHREPAPRAEGAQDAGCTAKPGAAGP